MGLVLTVALTVAAASSASAASKTINGFVGEQAGLSGDAFTQPRDVAVYTAGTASPSDDKIFATEALLLTSGVVNNRVHRLDADGNFELLWGKNVVRPGFPDNTGEGHEICTAALSGATGCTFGDDGDQAGSFRNVIGVSVNQSTGHVYVMDAGNHRVQEFDLDGHFIRAWGWDVVPSGQPDDTGSEFEICSNTCQAGLAGDGAGQFAPSSGFNTIMISPTAPNDVFVADSGNRRVLQFASDGDFIRAWGWGVDTGIDQFEVCTAASICQEGLSGAPGRFANGSPKHITVDPTGIVYASDTAGNNRIIRFESDPPPSPPNATGSLLAPLPSPTLLSDGETRGLEIDPATGNLLAARDPILGPTMVTEITDLDTPIPSVADTHVIGSEGLVQGMGWSPAAGHIYVTVTSLFTPPTGLFTGCDGLGSSCHGILVLATSTGPLDADMNQPGEVGTSSTSLTGSVDAGGGVARYRFQISDDGANWVDATRPGYVSGTSPVAVSAEASGLEPATLYRVRLVVSKQTEISTTETVVSNEDVFLTDAAPPEVATLGPSKRTDSSVRLRGRVDPQGSATTYRFEYGPAGGSFDQHVPIPDAQAGMGNTADLVQQDVEELEPETAYHYRVVASNAVGTSVGEAVTFTTKAVSEVKPSPGRAYELVSTGDKLSGVGVGVWFNGPVAAGLAGHAAYEDARFAVQGTFGAVLIDGKYALANDWALSERTPQGWVTRPLLTRQAFGAHPIVFIQMSATTPSMSLMGWSGTTVKLFADMEDWVKEIAGNVLYLRDWDQGKWEVFGPTQQTQGGGPGLTTAAAIALDGEAAVGWGTMRGLAGTADPTLDQKPATSSVYLDEIPDGPSDVFPGDGVRSPAGVCDDDTRVPRRLASGKLGEQECLAAPERQSIAIDATGGSFVVTFDGQSTAPISFNAPASAVQTALDDLTNLDEGDINGVTGGPGNLGVATPYLVRFDRALGDVPQLSVDGSGLTGGSATATVETVPVTPLVDSGGAALTKNPERAISSDGSRVFFMAPDPGPAPNECSGEDATTICPSQVYIRQRNSDGEVVTRWISKSEVTKANGASAEQDTSLLGSAIFQGASTDGDKVFFQTISPLTADDPNGQGLIPPTGGVATGTASEDSGDLYMYDMPNTPDADPADGDLTRISAGPTGNSECAAPATGALRFVSEDGSRLYFTCANALDDVPTAGDGASTTPASGGGAVNLYAYDATRPSLQRWRFVARITMASPIGPCATTATRTGMSLGPNNDADGNINIHNMNCVRGTQDGSLIMFWTAGQLTDDDPDAVSGDIYAYDTVEDELIRVSAPLGGVGGSYPCAPGSSSVQCYGDGGVGASAGDVPLPTLGIAQAPQSDDWMVFFQSKSRLIPADHDSNYDVYQYKDGELSLISSDAPGTSDAFFKGNDRTGTNVYLATRDRLSWQDKDSVLDIYSARVGDGIPEPPDPKEPCNPVLDECQPPGQPIQPGQTDSDNGSDGNPPPTGRVALTLATPSAKARHKAARTGTLRVRVTTTSSVTIELAAKARIARKTRRIGLATKRASGAGVVTLTLKLSKAARKQLRAGKALRVTLTASTPSNSRPATTRLSLKR